MDVKELKERKKALKLTTIELAKKAGLPYGTVSKIMTGETQNPTMATLELLDNALSHEEMVARVSAYKEELLAYIQKHLDEKIDQIKFEKEYRAEHNLDDAPIPYAKPRKDGGSISSSNGNLALFGDKRVTEEILAQFGEDRNVELIDGHIIVNEAPGMDHQMVVQNLGYVIHDFIRANKGKCVLYSVGVNVRLDEDDYTVVIPDIVVLCDKSRMNRKCIIGAPDWVIEVTSPSTRDNDYDLKMHKYMHAGVREYWVIDLEREKIVTFIEGQPMETHIYGFEDEVPVYIYEAKLKIKLTDIGIDFA